MRELPRAFVAGTLIPLFFYLYALAFPSPDVGQSIEKHLADVAIVAIAVAVTVWTAILTVAIGCFVVIVMKGPAYVADPYALPDFEEPATSDKKESVRNPSDH